MVYVVHAKAPFIYTTYKPILLIYLTFQNTGEFFTERPFERMKPKINLSHLYIAVGLISWLGLAIVDNPAQFDALAEISLLGAQVIKNTFLVLLFFATLLFYKINISQSKGQSFIDLLWRLVITGIIIAILLALHHLLADKLMQHGQWSSLAVFVEQLVIVTAVVFGAACFYIFKKMILYQKTKESLYLWRVFEYMLYAAVWLTYVNWSHSDIVFQLCLVPMLVLGAVLSLNLHWIAYLNSKQKWTAIALLLLVLLLAFMLLANLFLYAESHAMITDLTSNVALVNLLAFEGIYSLFSVLVLLFNLPTSSVFEKKFSEVINIQKMAKSAQFSHSEEEVFKNLFDSVTATLLATQAALEVYKNNDSEPAYHRFIHFNIAHLEKAKKFIRMHVLESADEFTLIENINTKKNYHELLGEFSPKTMLIIPLENYGERLGKMYLFSNVKNGFEKEMIEIALTYVHQATNSIINLRLTQLAVNQARYVRELEIAKRVQEALLPPPLAHNEYIEACAYSHSADEVGGDYYDYYWYSPTKLAVVIADVSGKGTSAAFHMAKTKGIFHSLVSFSLPISESVYHLNKALSACLDKGSFVTLTWVEVDFENKKFACVRAGHCPTLYYHGQTHTAEFITQTGVGLGILRGANADLQLRTAEAAIYSGDVILLFTDGVTEARNMQGEQFGTKRLKEFLISHKQFNAETILLQLKNSLEMFCETTHFPDDYTIVTLKIK